MSKIKKTVSIIEFESNLYPVSHWKRLRQFAIGTASDPKGLFLLTADMWDCWPYALNGIPSRAREFRLHFNRYQTFLKLYVKWYCHHILLGKAGNLPASLQRLPALLMHVDSYILAHHYRSIDDIAPSTIFQDLWDSLIKEDRGTSLSRHAVSIQKGTRAFWQQIRMEFGSPQMIPSVAPHIKPKPAEFAADPRKVIPEHVIREITNRVGLHRDGKELLSNFDHLRACVLLLTICLGRRIHELLLAPRGSGPDGPLTRLPSKIAASKGSLWFQFLPNKNGPADKVLISPEWEGMALYCVRELLKYSDRVRRFAAPQERELLILVSVLNMTRGTSARTALTGESADSGPDETEDNKVYQAMALKGVNFNYWLNGSASVKKGHAPLKGIMERWGITINGSIDGPTYRLLTNYARHTRQSALALDLNISPLAKQRDLNHRDLNAQFAYQHRLHENNDLLIEKIKQGKLFGRGVEWLSEVLGVKNRSTLPQTGYKPGCPQRMTPRMRTLIRNNPIFLEQNLVPKGICVLPLGPGGCKEFLNCTSAADGGCHSFFVDLTDPQMLHQLNKKADEERQLQRESAAEGKVVQSQKREVLAKRTEVFRDEAMRRASADVLARLRRMQTDLEEDGV